MIIDKVNCFPSEQMKQDFKDPQCSRQSQSKKKYQYERWHEVREERTPHWAEKQEDKGSVAAQIS